MIIFVFTLLFHTPYNPTSLVWLAGTPCASTLLGWGIGDCALWRALLFVQVLDQAVNLLRRCYHPGGPNLDHLGPYEVDPTVIYHDPALTLEDNLTAASDLSMQAEQQGMSATFLAEPVLFLVPSNAEPAFRLDPQIAITRRDEQAFRAQQARKVWKAPWVNLTVDISNPHLPPPAPSPRARFP